MAVSVIEQKIASIFRSGAHKQEINQKAMGEDLHISPQLVSHILTGKRSFGVDRMAEIAEYLQDPDIDFKAAAELFYTPKPLDRKRRDGHPLSKMVGQDKEEMERIEIEKKNEIWDLLSIPPAEITSTEKEEVMNWLIELVDEISAEIAVFSVTCERYSIDSRLVVRQSQESVDQ